MKNSSLEDLTKIGSIYGVYFLIQAYGYSIGFADGATNEVKPININEAIVFGFKHLSHFFRPWDGTWPMTPMFGLLLLLYTVYLPKLTENKSSKEASTILKVYYSAFFSTCLFSFISGVVGARSLAESLRGTFIDPIQCPAVLSFAFLSLWVFCYLSSKLFFNNQKSISIHEHSKFLTPEIFSALAIGLLLSTVYLGSEFDGARDSLTKQVTGQ